MRVPFTDLRVPFAQQVAILQHVQALADSQSFIGGATVTAFEEAWAEYVGARYCVSCGNGTDAVELAARSLYEPGEVVTVPALTFIGTVEGLERAHLLVEVVDVAEETLLAEQAMVAVPLYGPRQMRGDHDLVDAAQAHGAQQGKHQAMTWSFYPTKNLGAWGDAGAVTTNDEGLADEVRSRANHGGLDGWNSRMDAIQAAVLLAKLPHLDEALDGRRAAGDRYRALLDGRPWVDLLPGLDPWHLFVVRVPAERRGWVRMKTHKAGVDVRVHYEQTVKRWGGRDLPGECPIAEQAVGEILSLPLWPTITVEQQEYVVETLIGALNG